MPVTTADVGSSPASDPRASTPIVIRVLRIGFAVLGAVALAWIPLRNIDVEAFSVANYFSYFTILSNVATIVVLLVGGVLDPGSRAWQSVRGAVTVYMVITCAVYAVLLANIDVMLTDRWINDVMHRLLPLVLLADWILAPPRTKIEDSQVLQWLAFPAVYGVYSLIRGEFVDWYPYPFLDPREQGYVSLAIGLVVLTVALTLLALAVGAVGRLAARWRYRNDAHASFV
ncbi:Pr6Pr family membrane protein [Antrihabitans sp. YC3-6]|uniref:Pr6Pr family membrane protein n=1 Tax=Antrihabitans stalagmiti TaxID=2799499 RepID=A0A934NUB7_9NOCA|nr:Pr6Pr family membrane protein [Antrihabitans stalagmiti]MBJ8341438.1 Pr6Pr family membrane protein [Antrihabitans stalagmiti]